MTDRIDDVWGPRTPHAQGTDWPVRVDIHLEGDLAETDVDRWVRSACTLCSNGCGLEIAVKDGRMVGVRGPPRMRSTTAGSARRASTGRRRGRQPRPADHPAGPRERALREATWDEAMGRIVARSKDVLARKGPLGTASTPAGSSSSRSTTRSR